MARPATDFWKDAEVVLDAPELIPGLPDREEVILDYIDSKLHTKEFSQPGSAIISASGAWRAPVASTIRATHLNAVTAPAGSDLIVQFKKNGTTFRTLTMTAGTTTEQTGAEATALAAGDKVTVNATSVGSGTAATGVMAQIDVTLDD